MKTIFFSGIGGIGMSALARYFLAPSTPGVLGTPGVRVVGSDSSDSSLLAELESEGATIFRQQKAGNLPQECDLLVYSEAVPFDAPERVEARRRSIPEQSYFQALGEVSSHFQTIAVAGTHGKTTTTAMLALACESLDPTVIIGSKVPQFGNKNFRSGKGKTMIVEACEYRESFLHLHPFGAIIVSCEPDHLDYYGTAERYFEAFEKFVAKIPVNGFLVIGAIDENAQRIAKKAVCRVIVAPANPSGWINPTGWNEFPPGEHNRANASLAIAAAELLGVDAEIAKQGLSQFTGTWRRFERKGSLNGCEIYDDYGHHPTEIRVTLKAMREKFPEKRIVVVFEPHQYSRTREFLDEFAASFADSDLVFIPSIYRARDSEADIASVSPQMLVERIKSHRKEAIFSDGYEKTVELLRPLADENTVILTMGAGPVNKIGESLLRKMA